MNRHCTLRNTRVEDTCLLTYGMAGGGVCSRPKQQSTGQKSGQQNE
jgi:hypothetical protein